MMNFGNVAEWIGAILPFVAILIIFSQMNKERTNNIKSQEFNILINKQEEIAKESQELSAILMNKMVAKIQMDNEISFHEANEYYLGMMSVLNSMLIKSISMESIIKKYKLDNKLNSEENYRDIISEIGKDLSGFIATFEGDDEKKSISEEELKQITSINDKIPKILNIYIKNMASIYEQNK